MGGGGPKWKAQERVCLVPCDGDGSCEHEFKTACERGNDRAVRERDVLQMEMEMCRRTSASAWCSKLTRA